MCNQLISTTKAPLDVYYIIKSLHQNTKSFQFTSDLACVQSRRAKENCPLGGQAMWGSRA